LTVSLDTSVLVALYAKDAHTSLARTLLARLGPIIVSDWAAAEFSTAIRLKVRQGILSPAMLDAVEAGFDEWLEQIGARRPVLSEDHVSARALVRRHAGLRAPDALHIATAMRLDAGLATFDARQAEVSRREGLTVIDT
jgi:predicted nucleic acid-binding protein